MCSRVVSCCRIRPAASGPEKRESAVSNRNDESRRRGLARSNLGYRQKRDFGLRRAKGRREAHRDGKVTMTRNGGASFSVSATRPNHVGSVTSRGKAPLVVDVARSSRGVRRSDLGGPGKCRCVRKRHRRSGEATEVSEARSQGFVMGKRTPRDAIVRPAEADSGVVKHRVPRMRAERKLRYETGTHEA